MKKLVFAVYDMQANYYDDPMLFLDEKLAIASIRRYTRDMYLKKEITYDNLSDRQFCLIGVYDTETGLFDNAVDTNKKIRMSDFVGDMVVKDEV